MSDEEMKKKFFNTTFLARSYERELKELEDYGFQLKFEMTDSSKIKMIVKRNNRYIHQCGDMFEAEHFLEGIRAAALIYG